MFISFSVKGRNASFKGKSEQKRHWQWDELFALYGFKPYFQGSFYFYTYFPEHCNKDVCGYSLNFLPTEFAYDIKTQIV